MTEQNNETKGTSATVQCCAECPFVQPEPKCGQDDSIELDAETMEDDVPVSCPMTNGKPLPHGDGWVKLAGWLVRKNKSGIDD